MRVVQADYAAKYGISSRAQHRVWDNWEPLRRAGATARSCCSRGCRAMGGSRPAHAPPIAIVLHSPTQRRSNMASSPPTRRSSRRQPTFREDAGALPIDRPTCALADARDIVTGGAKYGLDATLPACCRVASPRTFGCTVSSFDPAPALAVAEWSASSRSTLARIRFGRQKASLCSRTRRGRMQDASAARHVDGSVEGRELGRPRAAFHEALSGKGNVIHNDGDADAAARVPARNHRGRVRSFRFSHTWMEPVHYLADVPV